MPSIRQESSRTPEFVDFPREHSIALVCADLDNLQEITCTVDASGLIARFGRHVLPGERSQ
ncbi:hypothetical protein [Pararhizobium gei]|uniref:hypothetical protein n=1 Tax=Pararhizobium gei TaxID=1395951 RepID=UPI0023DBCBFE|nr:hypothetical protein [Rhizobium gei]